MIVFRNPLLELARIEVAEQGFPKHSHDEFVVSANLNGWETVWLDGRGFEIGTDGLTTYNPGQVQASRVACDGDWRCVSLYVQPAAFERYFHVPFEFQRSCMDDPGLARALAALVELDELAEESCVALLAVLLTRGGQLGGRLRPIGDERIARVQARLRDDLSSVPNLEALAAEAGVSPAHLVRAFHRSVGLPPLAWQMQERINEARRLLRAGEAIAQVALAVGFADQAHFSKAFARFAGMSPRRFKQVVRTGDQSSALINI